jgi:hypothetical protein
MESAGTVKNLVGVECQAMQNEEGATHLCAIKSSVCLRLRKLDRRESPYILTPSRPSDHGGGVIRARRRGRRRRQLRGVHAQLRAKLHKGHTPSFGVGPL